MRKLDLAQLRKQAKERVRERRAAGRPITLAEAQFELARGHGFASWPKLKAALESRAGVMQRAAAFVAASVEDRDRAARHAALKRAPDWYAPNP